MSVDDTVTDGEYSDEELGSLAVNLGSLNHRKDSDTEADFLDKDESIRRTLHSKLKELEGEFDNAADEGERKVSKVTFEEGEKEADNTMADDEYSVCGSDNGTTNTFNKEQVIKPPRSAKVGFYDASI